ILFGIVAFARPGGTALGLIYVFGAFAFIDGVTTVALSVDVAQLKGRWWPMMLAGIAGMAIGVIAFTRPPAAAVGPVPSIPLCAGSAATVWWCVSAGRGGVRAGRARGSDAGAGRGGDVCWCGWGVSAPAVPWWPARGGAARPRVGGAAKSNGKSTRLPLSD